MSQPHVSVIVKYLRKRVAARSPEAVPDRDLLRRFASQRDEAAFTMLVQRHGPMILQLCRRLLHNWHDAEDVCQAVFLVLAAKAASRHWHESVANWLYQVAYHLALKARAAAARRRAHDSLAIVRPHADPADEITARELQSALDEELARLPAKYRAPLVLCYLEGATRDEAARQLGWPLGTLKSRVERGRQLLHSRLSSRGLTLSAALSTALLPGSAAQSALPAELAGGIVQAALRYVAGQVATGAAGAGPALDLARGLLQAMFLNKLKTTAVWLVGGCLLAAGVGLAVYRPAPAEPGDARREDEPQAPLPAQGKPEAAGSLHGHRDRYGDPLPPEALSRLGTLRFRHGVGVTKAVFSPDGKLLATSGFGQGSIRLWDAVTGKELRRWPSLDTPAAALAFSPDGKLLAVSASTRPLDGKLLLLDVAMGEEVRQLAGHQGRVHSMAFSPDGKVFASAAQDKTVRLWDPATGRELHRLEGHEGDVFALAFGPEGKVLVSGSRDQTIRLWAAATGNELGRLTGHRGAVYSVAFAPGGAALASGGEDNTIRLWDAATRKELRVLGRHPTAVGAVAFSADGKILASSGTFDSVALWDVSAGRELRRWKGPGTFMMQLSGFSPDGKTLASVSFRECAPRLWDVATGREVSPSDGHRSSVEWLAFAPDGKTLTSGDRGQFILRWNLATGQGREILTLPLGGVLRSALSPNGKILATWEGLPTGGALRLRDAATGQEFHLLGQHTWQSLRVEAPWRPLAFSPDGKQVASVDRERIVLWDVATGRKVRDFLGLRGEIHCVAFAPDGQALAAGIREGGDRGVLVWAAATGRELRALEQGEGVESLEFSPDGKLLASACFGRPIRLWDVASGKERFTLTGLNEGTYTLAFSLDGRLLAGSDAGKDKAVCLWEVLTGQVVCRFAGDEAGGLCVAFSPDGRVLASGSLGSTILLWDLTHGRKEARPQPARLTAAELEKLWEDLGDNAAKAHRAIWLLVAASGQVAPLMHERLRPVEAVDAGHVRRLIDRLDDDRFAEREKARAALEELREQAEPALRRRLAEGQPSPESRSRIERLLEPRPVSGAQVRRLRAIQVLEQVGDGPARQLLKRLAEGAPEARETQQAREALKRLAERPATPP